MIAAGFRDAIRAAGLAPPDHIEPGRFHRFPGADKRNGNTAGWCLLFGDGQGGVFGDWSADLHETWQAKRDSDLSSADRDAFRRQVEAAKRERDRQREADAAQSRDKAAAIWTAAAPAPGDHPYLNAKGIAPHGLRIGDDGRLVVPVRDTAGTLHSLQFIGPDGGKRFLSGGRTAGHYHIIGNPGDLIYVAEGFATGASIHEATGQAVAVAFNAGNLEAVAGAMRGKFPEARIIIAADNDESGTGQEKAREAAQAVGGLLAVPSASGCDWNDVHRQHGADVVRDALEVATPPQNPAPDVVYRRVSDIEARPINWLWRDKIARGKPTLIAGNPGLGKSQITMSVAAIVSRGGRWPVDRTACDAGNVVILSAEDAPEDTIRPRLEAAGADLNRCFVLEAVCTVNEDGKPIRRAFTLRRDIDRLSALLEQIGNVALVIVDPISAYLSGTDSHNNAEVRAALAPLAELADRHGAAVVVVSHLNKSGSTDPLSRVTGSLAFVAAARAAFVVTADADDDRRRLFLPLKNNLAECREGLAYRLEGCTAQGIETSRVSWEADPVTITADEALNKIPDEEKSALDEAEDWLRELLTGEGEMTKREIMRIAKEEGFAERTIHRARQRLRLTTETEGFGKDKQSLWRLPHSCQPPSKRFGTNESMAQKPTTKGFPAGESDQSCQSCQPAGTGTDGTDGAYQEEF